MKSDLEEPEDKRNMRRRFAIFSVIGATLATLAVGSFGVLGAGAQQGNSGTVKIFDGDKELPANDPKVCGPFTVQGLNFDAGEQVTVDIVGHGGPNSGPGEYHNVFTTNQNGAFSSSPINLPEGMYKLNSEDGEGGGDKNKVFKIECAPVTTTTTTTTVPKTTTTTVPKTTTTTPPETKPKQPEAKPTPPEALTVVPPARAPSPVREAPVFTG